MVILDIYLLPHTENDITIDQRDEAPVFYVGILYLCLNESFLERWIGREGSEPCPPRYPDFIPLNVYLYDYVK
jgi:hypothetical protein